MFKCELNELCQKSGWNSPVYSCDKEGQDHSPLFRASVVVNGSKFHSAELFTTSKAAYNDAAKIAFSHYSIFPHEVPVAEMKKLKKLKLTTMSSCSNKDKATESSNICLPTLPEVTAMEITPPDLAVPTTDEPDLNKSAESYLLCNKVRVYTSIPDVVLPKGSVVLPISEGKWTIVSLE